jgi:hypothetical protein
MRPTVYACQGKKCRRACAHEGLVRSLRKVGEVRLVSCQKICEGSVIGVALEGQMEWFSRVDSPKVCVQAKRMVEAGRRKKLDKAMKKRRVKAFSGRFPR